MDLKQLQQTANDMEKLYKATMELYKNYFDALKAAIEITPNSEVEKLTELHALAREAQQSLEHDIAIFDKAVSMDAEGLKTIDDELKIQSIYQKLHE